MANALKALSTFLGAAALYTKFKERYEINYGQRNSILKMIGEPASLQEAVGWLVEEVRPLGLKYYLPAAFTVYSGLRASEGFRAIKLASQSLEGYYNAELRCLEHFRYPEFMRRTKNAYLTFISDDLLDLIRSRPETVDFPAFNSKLKREALNSKLKEARRAWASELRNVIPSEAVDLLQGRISSSVFVRHYYRPDLKEIGEKVLGALEPLEKQLFQIGSESSSTPRGGVAFHPRRGSRQKEIDGR